MGEIAAFLGRIGRETGVPGIAVAIRVGGKRLSFGAGCAGRAGEQMTPEHRFHAGCTIKLLLAVVALELAARGRLELDAPIAEPLVELRGTRHGETVRVRHLLSHTSGYRGTHLLDPSSRDLDWAKLIAYLHSAPQLFTPGTVFSYEHTESVLLGRILERAAGRDPLSLVCEMLLEPMGITPQLETDEDPLFAGRHDLDRASGRFVPIAKAPSLSSFWNAAFASFTLSTSELAGIAEALLPGAESPISEATREHVRRAAVRLPPTFGGPIRELVPTAFGLGAAAFPRGFHGRNGLTHGQCVALRYSPSRQIAVAIGMNAMLPHFRDHVLDAICADLAGRRVALSAPPFELDLAALAGRYVGPGASRVLATFEHGRLELAVEHGEHRLPVELVVDGERKLIVRSPLPQLSVGFFRTEDGDVGLMLGANAYKRVARRRPAASIPQNESAAADSGASS